MIRTKRILLSASLGCVLAAGAFAKEAQPGDDRGGRGKPVQMAKEAQPGDDRGGRGKPVQMAKEAQPGDDRGGHGDPLRMA